MQRQFVLLLAILALAIAAVVVPLNQRRVHAQAPPQFQYVVKFVCGKSPTQGQPQVVATGNYFTAINVHNPNNDGVGLRKKFAVALPREKSGPVSQFFNAELGADRALEIDCVDIWEHLHMHQTFVKGFAVIESKVELDVVAVYTAAGASGQIETMDVERVPARRPGGGGGLTDLIPAPDANGNFCRRDPSGRLIVTVRNLGSGDAAPSVVKVTYSNGVTNTASTPLVPGGGSVDVLVAFPGGCFTPDCGFRITVDSTGVVTETNELNNTASGTCLG
jgi:hypothetical protein